LPLIYELDRRDEWTDPRCWAKANPGLGAIKSIATLAENVEKAKRDPKFLPTVLTKDFNIPENTSEAWLDYTSIVNETVVPMSYLQHSYAVGGCDLSAVRDLTCATLLIKKPNDTNYYVLQHYFLPKARVDDVETSNRKEAPYRLWADQGLMTICDGASVDFHSVTAWFTEMVTTHDIRPLWIGYDAALSGYWREEMEQSGFDMEKIRQGPFTWTYPMKQMGAAFSDHQIIYQNHAILRWCLLNTGVKTTNKDGIESIQPVKSSATRRIDGAVSLLNAWTCLTNHEEEYKRYLR
jgi:phage terminase large subunit-like protein